MAAAVMARRGPALQGRHRWTPRRCARHWRHCRASSSAWVSGIYTGAGCPEHSLHRKFKSCLCTMQLVCAHANVPPHLWLPLHPGEMNDAAEVLLAIYERVSRQRWAVMKSGAADLLP